jgi:hypothetical protein
MALAAVPSHSYARACVALPDESFYILTGTEEEL